MQQVEYPKKNKKATGATRVKIAADLKKKYNAGASIRDLVEETGRSYGFIHRLLREAGATLRGRGGDTKSASVSAQRRQRG